MIETPVFYEHSAILISSHILSEVEHIANVVGVLANGGILLTNNLSYKVNRMEI